MKMKKIALLFCFLNSTTWANWEHFSAEELYNLYQSADLTTKQAMQRAVTTLHFNHDKVGFEYGSATTHELLQIFPNVTTVSEENPTDRFKDASIFLGPKDFSWLPKALIKLKVSFSSCDTITDSELALLGQGLQTLHLATTHKVSLNCSFLPRTLTELSVDLSPIGSDTIEGLPPSLTFLKITAVKNQLSFTHLTKLKTLTSHNRGKNISLHTFSLPESITSLSFSADICLISTPKQLKLETLSYEGPSSFPSEVSKSLSSFTLLSSLTSLTYNDWFRSIVPQDLVGFTSLTTLKIYELINDFPEIFSALPRTLTEFSVREPLNVENPDFTSFPQGLKQLHLGSIFRTRDYPFKIQEKEPYYLRPSQIEALPRSIVDLILEGYSFLKGERYLFPTNLTKLSFKGFSQNAQKFPADFFPLSLDFLQMTDESFIGKEIIDTLPKSLTSLAIRSMILESLPPALRCLEIFQLSEPITGAQISNLPRTLTYLEIGSLPKPPLIQTRSLPTTPYLKIFRDFPPSLTTLKLFFKYDLSLNELFTSLPRTLTSLSLSCLNSERTIRYGTQKVIITKKSKTLKDFLKNHK